MMDSMDVEYANAIAKHRLSDKKRRPTPIAFPLYPNNSNNIPGNAAPPPAATLSPGVAGRRVSVSDRSQIGPGVHPPSLLPPLQLALAPSVSKLRRTSQFFSKLTNSFVKSPNPKASLAVPRPDHRSDRSTLSQHSSRSSSASHPLEAASNLSQINEASIGASPIIRSRSDFDPILGGPNPKLDLNGVPPDLRRDSMYSVRTSATAPASNRSCPDSPIDSCSLKDTMSAHFNIPEKISEDREVFLSALRSFNQIQPGLGEGPGNGHSDFQQLRDALHNFKVSDKGDCSESPEEGCRKDSLSTTFTGETSGSEPDSVPSEALLGLSEALAHVRLAATGSVSNPRQCPQGAIFPRVHLAEETFRDDASETASLVDELPAISDMSPPLMAKCLFNNDNRILPHNEIAEYLGKRGDFYAQVLHAYMDHFNFTGLRLDEAFRSLCTHLFLHGETQVIDRILAEFARRYWDCNPDSVFKSQGKGSPFPSNVSDVVYAVSYSILLLNTDLHVARNHHKMSRSDFIKNTMSAIDSCTRAALVETDGSQAAGGASRSRSGESFLRPGPACNDEISHTLKEMYTSIKSSQILQHIEPKVAVGRRTSTASSPTSSLTYGSSLYRARSATRLKQAAAHGKKVPSWDLQRQKSGNSLNLSQMSSRTETPDLFFNASRPPPPQPPSINAKVNPTEAAAYPYFKSGLLTRKHLYERTDRKAPHRTWKDCYVVVDRGDIRMYRADRQRPDSEPTDPSLQLGVVSLRHCLAVTLPPPGYSSSRPYVFALQLPSGGVFLFQATSADQVAEWVVICNFWAARESKEPLPGGICSIDYGWGTAYGDDGDDDEADDALGVGRLPAPDSYQPVSSRQLFSEPQSQSRSLPNIQEWRPLPCPWFVPS
ncbi:hypothetical protein DSO57_1037152 [Entomophthora muscae]|uniref:Uncharacterized protein n=1 Tax=Entomophthora muscae TaxID=34485 RepID=A0ACC2RDR4_9FUNG|nr:hypothetical protein DSO57_1037152 [Entomophthora muscae]